MPDSTPLPRRPTSSEPFGKIAFWSLAALGLEVFVGFGLGFAPGWANDWFEGRLSIHEVWSTGMMSVTFAAVVTATIGIGAVLGLILDRFAGLRPYAWLVFRAWSLVGVFSTLACSRMLYSSIYAAALAMWPNGYVP